MIYHSRSCLCLMIFLEYALSAAVSASRYLSLFFTHYFGIVRQSPLFSTCYIQTAYFLGKVSLYNFYPLTDFSVRVFERDFCSLYAFTESHIPEIFNYLATSVFHTSIQFPSSAKYSSTGWIDEIVYWTFLRNIFTRPPSRI